MTERYLVPFVMKSTSITINDRSCYGEELKIVIFNQELHIHNKIQTFRKYFSKKSHWRWLPCLSEYINHARRKESRDFNRYYYMASYASRQDDPNRALWLATREGKMEPSCPLGTIRCIPQEKFPRKRYNKSFIDQVCSVKMAGYWPRSFFASLWTSTSSRSINTQKKELGQYPAILTEQTWSIKDLLYGFWRNFACGIKLWNFDKQNEMQLLAKFKQILYMGFRTTLSFRKFKVALNVSLNLSIYYSFRHVLKPGTPEHRNTGTPEHCNTPEYPG